MARPQRNQRVFVAVFPPAQTVAQLHAVLAQERLPEHRVVVEPYLTVQFVGDVPARELDDVMESVQRSVAGLSPFELAPKALMTLPADAPAKQFALQTDLPTTLRELKSRLARRFARGGGRRQDAYLPRITIARFRAPVPNLAIEREVEMPAFGVSELRLVRSVLRPQGTSHPELGCFALGVRSL